jgi:hypothetical protein
MDGHEGATESNKTEGVKGDESENGSREDVTGESRQKDKVDAATVEAGRNAEGIDTIGEDNARECQNAATKERDGIRAMKGNSQEEIRRTPAEEDSFYTAR